MPMFEQMVIIPKFVKIDEENRVVCTYNGTRLIQDGFSSSADAEQWFLETYWPQIKEDIIRRLDEFNREFIAKHYPTMKLLGFHKQLLAYKEKLADSSISDDLRDELQEKISAINSIDEWVNNVMGSYYQIEAILENVASISDIDDAVDTINSTYNNLEASDPKILFKDVLI